MGMFDNIDFSCPCPNCKATVSYFQSKDDRCWGATLKPWQVDNFYTSCPNCSTWLEFSREREGGACGRWTFITRGSPLSERKKTIEKVPYIPNDEEDERFWNNRPTAVKVFEALGFELAGFNPSWTVINVTDDRQTVQLPDIVVGRAAKAMKLPWVFRIDDAQLDEQIKHVEELIQSGEDDLAHTNDWLKQIVYLTDTETEKSPSPPQEELDMANQSIFFLTEQLKRDRATLAQLQAERALRTRR